jgi:hypothetical protein
MIKQIVFALSLLASSIALAQEPIVGVEWDPVPDSRVGVYTLGIGSTSGTYEQFVDSTATEATIPDYGYETYYVAVRACKADKTLCSEWSNEISHDTPIDAPGNLRKAAANLESSLGNMTNAVAQVVDAINKLD